MAKEVETGRGVGGSTRGVDEGERLLRGDEVADRLQVSLATLSRWRRKGTGPQYVKLGNGQTAVIRYRLADVDTFIRGGMRRFTGEVGEAS